MSSLTFFYINLRSISQKNTESILTDKKALAGSWRNEVLSFDVGDGWKGGQGSLSIEHLLFRLPLTSNFQHKPQSTSIRDTTNLLSYPFQSRKRKSVQTNCQLANNLAPAFSAHPSAPNYPHFYDTRQPWREREDATKLDHDPLEFSLPKNKEIPNRPRSGDV